MSTTQTWENFYNRVYELPMNLQPYVIEDSKYHHSMKPRSIQKKIPTTMRTPYYISQNLSKLERVEHFHRSSDIVLRIKQLLVKYHNFINATEKCEKSKKNMKSSLSSRSSELTMETLRDFHHKAMNDFIMCCLEEEIDGDNKIQQVLDKMVTSILTELKKKILRKRVLPHVSTTGYLTRDALIDVISDIQLAAISSKGCLGGFCHQPDYSTVPSQFFNDRNSENLQALVTNLKTRKNLVPMGLSAQEKQMHILQQLSKLYSDVDIKQHQQQGQSKR